MGFCARVQMEHLRCARARVRATTRTCTRGRGAARTYTRMETMSGLPNPVDRCFLWVDRDFVPVDRPVDRCFSHVDRGGL